MQSFLPSTPLNLGAPAQALPSTATPTPLQPVPKAPGVPAVTGPAQNVGGGLVNGKYVATGVNAGINPYTVGQTLATTPVNPTPGANNVQNATATQVPGPSVNNAQNSLDAHLGSVVSQPGGTVTDETGNASLPVTEAGQTKSKISQLMDKLAGKTADTNALNDTFQTDQKQQAAVDTFNSYNKRRLELANQEQNFLANSGSYDATTKQNMYNEMKRNNSFELANEAIAVQASQGNYTAALDTVKRKIDAIYEPLQQQIDNLGKYYQLNQNDLSESDKVKLENQRFQMQNNLDTIKQAKVAAHQYALQNGISDPAVLNKIDAAQSADEAYQAVGATQATSGQAGTQPIGKPDPVAAGFANRSVDANATIDQLGEKFSGSFALGGFLPNQLKSADRQVYEQAKRDFSLAVLRKESGAAISQSEFDSTEKQYFPQAGDSPEVIAQKKQSRANAINALIGSAGSAYKGTYLDAGNNTGTSGGTGGDGLYDF